MDLMGTSKQKGLIFHQSKFKYLDLFKKDPSPYYLTDLGVLFSNNCLDILPLLKDQVVDTIFADPPFNLNKKYGANSNDDLSDEEYLDWCYKWIDQCIRTLKPGGSLFLYNLPKWNIILGAYLAKQGLSFRHWIAISVGNSLPISGRLYPAHYSLLYYSKGKPKTFRKIRTPIELCRHCGGEIRDYGGHRNAMNPKGVNLKDVWTDIPPVRHWKFKSKARRANSLSTKILDRVVEISTFPGEIVLDPFGGSGTTFSVCESKHRHWIGIELDFADVIVERLEDNSIHHHKNDDYVED
ncbi:MULTISPECIES: DNA-methyltransferase [unclassified Nitrospina]|uniref:DNA-methyltransferase n=1 Tax=unclassified Nitrospina TaxID=2638683 RepID=UPI003F9BCDAD